MFARLQKKMELSRQRREKIKISGNLRLAVDENDLDKVVSIVKAHGNDPIVMNTFEGENFVIGSPGCWNRPPLCHAVANGKASMVRALLEAPAIDVNSVDPTFQNYTPLLVAVMLEYPDVVQALVTHTGIDVNAHCEYDEYSRSNLGSVGMFMSPAEYPEYDKNKSTALHLLAKQSGKYSGDLPDYVKAFLALPQLKLDVLDKLGWTPLMYAARAGNEAFVDALLIAGANPEMTNPSGCTAAKIAQLFGHERIEERLAKQASQEASRGLKLQ